MAPIRKRKSKRQKQRNSSKETHKPIRALVGEEPSNTLNEPDSPLVPYDIIINILKRLPVKSLIRFQCVSKDWNNLIKTPSFIQRQLHYSSHRNPLLLLKWFDSNSSQMQVALLDHSMKVLEVKSLPLINWLFDRTVGSSNGLLCFQNLRKGRYHFPLLLWNPAIREVRKVSPRTIINSEQQDWYGFGFSQVDKDYKIVRLKVPDYQFLTNPMEVYSLNSRSWKEVDLENLVGVAIRGGMNITINGVMYWIGGKQSMDDDCSLILSFDLSTEVWTVIPIHHLNYYHNKRLTEYENKLAVLAGIFGEDKSYSIHLWVMEEDTCSNGERWIWNKIFTSSRCPCVLDPITVWSNDIVFFPFYQFEKGVPTPILYLLNLLTNEFKRFAIRFYSYHRMDLEIFSYVESLVSIGNIN